MVNILPLAKSHPVRSLAAGETLIEAGEAGGELYVLQSGKLSVIRDGIVQHRRIDAFTDEHPSVSAFRRVLIPDHGHYSRVIADMFLDHFLACRFDEYAHEPLETFLGRTFATIDPHADALPGPLRAIYPRIRDEQWLLSYRDIEGIRFALRNMSRRFSRGPRLEPAVRHLVDSRVELERRFGEFMPDVIAFALRFTS